MGASVTKWRCEIKRLHVLAGFGHKWGVELTWDTYEPALTVQVLNFWVVLEWWPKDTDSFYY